MFITREGGGGGGGGVGLQAPASMLLSQDLLPYYNNLSMFVDCRLPNFALLDCNIGLVRTCFCPISVHYHAQQGKPIRSVLGGGRNLNPTHITIGHFKTEERRL